MKILNGFMLFVGILMVLAVAGCGGMGIDSETLVTQSGGRSISGYKVITQETGLNNSFSKQVVVSCPEGTKALGAGWGVLDATNVILDGTATYFAPRSAGSGWLVNARLKYPANREWKLRVSVLCAPATSLSGYQIVFGETSVSSTSEKYLSLSCPAGTKAVGAGWGTLDATDAILSGEATCFTPTYDGSGWLTEAVCTAPWTDWKLRSFLICVDSASLANYQIITASTEVSDFPIKQLSVPCPSGKKALCAGWSVLDGTSAILPGSALYALPAYNGGGWLTNAMNNATWPSGKSWKLRVRLICAD
jgi:hypothetical protein